MMFGFFEIIFPVFFLFVFGMIIFNVIKGIKEWSDNNKQLIVPADSTVVAKRTSVSHHNHGENNMHSTSTTYYVTFQFTNGERLELRLSGKEYGLIAEGDTGVLSFQGTRFIRFERKSIY